MVTSEYWARELATAAARQRYTFSVDLDVQGRTLHPSSGDVFMADRIMRIRSVDLIGAPYKAACGGRFID